MNTHLAHALEEMQDVIERARIRDASLVYAHKLALAVALIAPGVFADAEVSGEHAANVREILSECRALAAGPLPGAQLEAMLDGRPWDEVLLAIRCEVENERRLV